MSLAIEIDDVTEVLLADGWHFVAAQSFEIDAYEYLWAGGGNLTVLKGGQEALIPAAGFRFEENVVGQGATRKVTTAGPLTAILAVRYKK